jgi:hypothetical protein
MNKVLADSTIVGRSPLVVEISGPASARKTTLLQALDQCHEKIVTGVRLHKMLNSHFDTPVKLMGKSLKQL